VALSDRRERAVGPPDEGRVEELFHAALEVGRDERAAFVASACEGDPALRAEVEQLLEADEEAGAAFRGLGTRVAGLAREALEEALPEHTGGSWVGRTVGPYRVVGRLGEGGMGVVYLAERADLQKRVALKVVRGTLGAPELVRRFLLERRVLARLAHPSIARLLDAGMTDDGAPWLAMELVEGQSITRFCDDRDLGPVARLRLFLQVCDAVAAAHAQLVVHRDIKPSNVLVDPAGQVKLLDFGIAKLLGEDEADAEATRTGFRVFSPDYAAPEQVTGEPVTTATDVHALGVLLFELLAGERPYGAAGGASAAMVRALLEEEPRRLSAVGRGRRPWGRELAGDLDAICLKALARDPGSRYRSAQQLADDVSRYLDGYPVEARLPTLRYRTAKFLRRNAAATAAAFAVVLALAAGLGASLWQGGRARSALVESEQVAGFLAELFEASDPGENRGRDIGARELLEEGVRRIDGLGDQPRAQARMLEVMARAYHGLGESETARGLAERSLAQRRALLGERHAEVAATLHTLGEVLDELGDREGSIGRYREALAIRRAELGPEDDRTSFTMIRLARLLSLVGGFEEAEALAREALDLRRAVHGPRHEATAAAMEALGLVRWQGSDDLDRAEELFRQALAIREEVYGPDDPRIDPALLPLSTILSSLGRPDEGEALVRRSVEIRRRVYGDDHPGVAYRLGSLAYVLTDAGRLDEGEQVYRDVLRRFREHYPGDYTYTATTLSNLGHLLALRGRIDAALAHHAEARDMLIRLHGEHDPNVALAHHNVGLQLSALGRLDEAEASMREAYTLRREIHGEHGAATLRTASILADILSKRERYDQAEELLREIMAPQREQHPDGHASLALTLERLAVALDRLGRPEEAEPLLAEAFAYWRESVAPDHRHRKRVAELLEGFLEARGRTEEAEHVRREEGSATVASATAEPTS
jgi:eukaryotic-like serine/threonine-protein kinase